MGPIYIKVNSQFMLKMLFTHECHHGSAADVGNGDNADGGDNGLGDGLLRVLGLLASGGDDVKTNEGVEARGRALEDATEAKGHELLPVVTVGEAPAHQHSDGPRNGVEHIQHMVESHRLSDALKNNLNKRSTKIRYIQRIL